LEDLYVIDTGDKDLRILTTADPDGIDDADEAQLWLGDGVLAGSGSLPVTIYVRRIYTTR
jgi:hypothetical protein